MSPDLSHRIRAYARQLEDDAQHVTFAELEHMMIDIAESPVTDIGPMRPIPRRWPRWAAAFAGALVLLIAAIGLPLWLLGGGSGVVIDQTTTTTPTPTTTLPTTTVPPMVDSWQRVGATVMNPAAGLFDMTQTSTGLVAVGFDPGEEDYRQNGAIFTSADGVTWARLAEDDPALTLGAVLMYGVTEGGPGLVAVGMGCENDAEPCPAYATAWTSIDGTSWTRTPYDPAVFGDTATESSAMLAVAATDAGLVAVGEMDYWTLDEAGVEESVTVHPAVWTSPDGISWERSWEGTGVALAAAEFIEVHTPSINAVTAGADGRLVAVGSTLDHNNEPLAAAWISPDGRSWERIDPALSAFGPRTVMQDVTWGSGGFVAVGTEDGRAPAIWVSPDGFTWTRVDLRGQPFDTTGTLASVAALEVGYVAAGPHVFTDQLLGWVTLWTSPDGLVWDRVHTVGEGGAMSIVATDAGIAVAGSLMGADNVHAAVWAGPSFDPLAPPADPKPPIPSAPEEEVPTGIGALEEGVSCEGVAEQGFSYAEAVSYWLRYELTDDFDLDAHGPPCAAAFDVTEVDAVFGQPDAPAVRIVEEHRTGTFDATGPAVDAGLICSSGTINYTENPEPTEPDVLWRWEDELTCDDGSGMFLLGVDEYIDDPPAMYGVWNIVSGTGAYETLRGGGATDSIFDGYDASIGRLWYESNEN